jgi:predicted DCC family thiol-disulfide oxidoreductase YuxK
MIVVFDAKCLLCSSSVHFLLRHDQKRVFQFASMQGATGSALLAKAGLSTGNLQTLLLVDGERVWQNTAATLRIAHGLGWPWRIAWLLWLVPAPLRDALYRAIARHRYRLFGSSDTCLIPPQDHAARFLD